MSSIRPLVAKKIGFHLKSIIKREPAMAVLKELNQTQWFSKEQLHELRTNRLRQLLTEVGENVPFYREEIKKLGANPQFDDPWQILYKLPTLDKKTYRSLGEALQSEHPRRKPFIIYTSGTTGEYLKVKADHIATTYRYLAGLRGRQWYGVEPGDSQLKIWGGGSRTAWRQGHYYQAVVRWFKESLLDITLLPPFFESDKELKKAVDLMFRKKPKFVLGYANTLHLFASYMLRNGIQAGPGWPKLVSYSSEMLSEWQCDNIRKAFNAPLASEYGSVEAGVIAYLCPKGNLHTSDDILVVEILDGDKRLENGQLGEVVVTSIIGSEYPIIRYRQADLAVLTDKTCSCGVGLGIMSDLKGRLNEQFFSPSGGVIDFVAFALSIKDQPAIKKFKIVERDAGDLVFLCELHKDAVWPQQDRERLLHQCLDFLPSDVRLSIGYIGHLPPEPSGKFRIMIPKSESEKYLRNITTG